MMLTIISKIAKVKEISILLNQVKKEISLTIEIPRDKPLSESLVDKSSTKNNTDLKIENVVKPLVKRLSAKNDTDLNTKGIAIYMTSLLLEQYKSKIGYTCNENDYKATIRISI